MAHHIKRGKNLVKTTAKRCVALLCCFLIFGLYLCLVLFRMQVTKYGYYQQKVLDQITTSSIKKAKRGTIYDANGNVLASTETLWRVFLSPVDIKEASEDHGVQYAELIASGLSNILGYSYQTILSKAKQSGSIDVTVARGVNEQVYHSIQALIAEHGLANMIHTEASSARYYPCGSFAAHLLGFTGTDNQGLFGLEYQYDQLLKGQDGYYVYAKDAAGNEMPSGYINYVEATDGCSLVTTIDSYIQQQLEYQISEIEETFDVKNRVCGIIMNVQTGAILAMATTDAYDLNDPYTLSSLFQDRLNNSGYEVGSDEYKKYKTELLYTMWQNKPVSEAYEPGSTFKIVTVAAGLETGSVIPSQSYFCKGYFPIGGYNISCHKHGGHGSLNLEQGLQQSCNPVMIQVSQSIGAERFYSFVKSFGYLEKTGIDLPSEGTSIFHDPEKIGPTELATISFGQRFKITPLQQLTAIAAVANGGTLLTPYVVEQVVDDKGNVLYSHTPEIKRQVISKETAKTVSDILERGVSGDGGAKNAAAEGYLVAAKTGTSEKFDILDENGNSYLRIGSCVGFGPTDQAKIAILIVVDEPTTAKYGSMVAAPYVGRLMQSLLPYLGVESSSDAQAQTVTVGNYTGLGIKEAEKQIKALGVKVQVIGDGDTVLSQMPQPADEIHREIGSVILYTESPSQTNDAITPSFLGMKVQQANQAAIEAGLNVRLVGVQNYNIGAGATVTAQSFPPGTKTKRGDVIELTVLYTDDEG